jgi:hypothetical protein
MLTTKRVIPLLAFLLMAGVIAQPVKAYTGFSGADSIVVWNTNLKMGCGGDPWAERQFFTRMSEYNLRPDIVLAQEVPGRIGCDRRADFDNWLEETTGSSYGYMQARTQSGDCDPQQDAGCVISSIIVAFRQPRFEAVTLADGSPDKLLWAPYWEGANGTIECERNYDGEPDGDPTQVSDGQREIAVRLHDNAQNKNLIAASFHISSHIGPNQATDDNEDFRCVAQNLKRINYLFNTRAGWDTVPLTIIGGDHNEQPGKLRNRNETTLACWYQAQSMQDLSAPDCTAPEYQFEGGYYDPVRVNHLSDICTQWTHTNPSDGNPTNAQNDSCASGRDRIDLIWVRWKDASGNPRDLLNPDGAFSGASVDRGYSGTDSTINRYSDHRAVTATVRWSVT